MGERIKWNYEMVKNFVESKGYKLISKEYRKAFEVDLDEFKLKL